MAPDETKLTELIGRLVGELSAGYGGVMVAIGDKLGLYKAMAGSGPISSQELAKRTKCAERYVRVAELAGRRRLCALSPKERHL